MDSKSKFPDVQMVARGGMSCVYELGDGIVVKVPKTDDFSRNQFCNELKIYKTLSERTTCAFIVQCFYYTSDGIFLEHMRGESLAFRIQAKRTFDHETWLVTHVRESEPLHVQLKWIDDITQAIAFLEDLNLAHGDLRPENILLDGNKIKATDFDNAAAFGTPLMICQEPWARELKECEKDYDVPGCEAGLLGPRTEQFALGSIYYYISYGMEAYGDQSLTDTPRDRGQELRKLLREMQFPVLHRDPMIDELISNCWYNIYPAVASLAEATKSLFDKRCSSAGGGDCNLAIEGKDSKQAICRHLEEQGLFGFLRSSQS